ncbi:MAG: hypothetical protein K9I02_06975 [Haliscomenobacter sp.]|nr:hypothetical protein [Haliscomenobacter sp.]MCF8318474.1 hypothetical protein [Haliscomenobacter sp.]
MKVLKGKSEILILLKKVLEKFEKEKEIIISKNSNRKNYEPIARLLSEISNQLPYTSEELKHEKYPIDYNPRKQEYPFRKYDITGNQIKDAYFNQIISNPRSFLVDACYIYLYGMGRLGFSETPVDDDLLDTGETNSMVESRVFIENEYKEKYLSSQKAQKKWLVFSVFLMLIVLFTCIGWKNQSKNWEILKNDLKIMPYAPSQEEIDSLEGVWICYIGSPQARISESNRYHLVVSNIVDIKFKNGYFTLSRFGASFNHDGFAQFESPWLISIFTYVKNKLNQIESPRHSLLPLNKDEKFKSAISASWNFDSGNNNDIIGIREVYIKLGKGGYLEEIINTVENASCKCKIIKWHKENGAFETFELKNQLLDNLSEEELAKLIDENSILLRVPSDGLILKSPPLSKAN